MKTKTAVLNKHCLAFVAAAVAVPSFAFTRIDPVPTPTLAEPVYTITVESGATTNVADWIAACAPDYDGTGTIIKEGAGTLEVSDDTLKAFAGDIQIKAGRWFAKSRTAFGTTAGKTWVEDGAALDMYAEKNYTDKEQVKEVLYLSGVGPDGKGGLVSSGSLSEQVMYLWPLHVTLLGDAKIYCNAGGRRFTGMDFNLNGYTCTWHNAGWDWTYVDSTVVSNGCVITSGSTYLFQGAKFQGGSENVIRFKSGSGYRSYNSLSGQGSADASWTQIYEDNTKMYSSGGTSGWSGPVILEGSTALMCQNLWTWMVYWGPISGPGTIGGKSSGDSFGGYNCCSVGLRLACPTNSFTGGVNLRYNILDLTTDGALPAAGGKLTAKGSTVKLTGSGSYDLPAAEFTGTGVVYGARGAWRGSVVKKDAGELIYQSRVGSDLLDIQGGSVRLVASDKGLWEHLFVATEGEAADRQNAVLALYNTRETPETVISTFPDLWYSSVYSTPKRWQDYSTLIYSGYIWNPSDADVKWTFCWCFDDYSKLYINDALVSEQNGWMTVVSKTVTLHPGANKLEFRCYNLTGGGGASGANGAWRESKGFAYHIGETTSKDPADYTAFTRETAAQYFTLTDGSPEQTHKFLPQFTKVKLASGAVFDTAGYAYQLADVEGVGSFTNGSVIVTNGFSIAAADVNAGKKLSVTGKLTFAEGAKVDIAGEVDVTNRQVLNHKPRGTVIATATEGIVGLPVASDRLKAAHWETRLTSDGKSLELVYVNGLVLLLR